MHGINVLVDVINLYCDPLAFPNHFFPNFGDNLTEV